MSRSWFALWTLLAALAGPLLFADRARSESPPCPEAAYSRVCTPPRAAQHPADGLVPHPGYEGEYAAAAAPPRDEREVEDWRDYVMVPHAITNAYDDLFETLRDAAAKSYQALPKIVEADPAGYTPAAPDITTYDPFAEEALAEEAPAAPSEPAPAPPTAGLEPYESEFSGYGAADYLQDNFYYDPEIDPEVVKKIAEAREEEGCFFVKVSDRWLSLARQFPIVEDLERLTSEALFTAQQLASEVDLERLREAAAQSPPATEDVGGESLPRSNEVGFRLPDDDCGWECWRDMRAAPLADVTPDRDAERLHLDREAFRSVALSLRSLAGRLEAASNWVAELGGVDVAELTGDAPR